MVYVVLGPHFTVNILSLLRGLYLIYHDTSTNINNNNTSRSAFARNVEVLLVFSGSCIDLYQSELSCVFPPEFLVVFNRFSELKKYQIFDEKF